MNADSGSDAPFPFAGDNLLLLMGLPAGSRVLAIGDNLDSWRKLFRNCSASAQLPDHHSSTCGLILYHSTSAATRLAFAADMRRAREILADNGSILVFAENPASWRNLGRLKQEAFGALLSKLRDGHTRYEQELQRAGFGNVRRFHPLPGLGQPEELVAVGSSLLELPHYWHPVLHMANKLGVFRMLAEGFVIHAGLFQLDSGGVVGSINDEISRKCGRQRVRCMLERIDIRYRGALVLFLVDEATGSRLIARLASDMKMNAIIGKNNDFLGFLRNVSGLPETVKELLPRPICRVEYCDSVIYVETMIEGTVAWKANEKGIRENIFQGSMQFLLQLNLATRRLKCLDDQDLDNVFRDDLTRLTTSDVIEASFREKMVRLIQGLKQRLRGREVYLVASHGDYGYGNILVEPANGDLRGVIDWDTGRMQDLPGIDLFNFHCQKQRTECNTGIVQAYKEVVREFVSKRPTDVYRAFLEELLITPEMGKTICHVAFIREVSRTAQYPEHYLASAREYMAIYELLQDAIPL